MLRLSPHFKDMESCVIFAIVIVLCISGTIEDETGEDNNFSDQWQKELMALHWRDKRVPKAKTTRSRIVGANKFVTDQKAKVVTVAHPVTQSTVGNNKTGPVRRPVSTVNNNNNKQLGTNVNKSTAMPAPRAEQQSLNKTSGKNGIGCKGTCPGTRCLGHDGYCYVFVEKTFLLCEEAEKHCRSIGGHAASFHDESSYEAVKPLFLGHMVWLGMRSGAAGVGGSNMQHFDGTSVDFQGPRGGLSAKTKFSKTVCMFADKNGRWFAAVAGGANALCRLATSSSSSHGGTAAHNPQRSIGSPNSIGPKLIGVSTNNNGTRNNNKNKTLENRKSISVRKQTMPSKG